MEGSHGLRSSTQCSWGATTRNARRPEMTAGAVKEDAANESLAAAGVVGIVGGGLARRSSATVVASCHAGCLLHSSRRDPTLLGM